MRGLLQLQVATAILAALSFVYWDTWMAGWSALYGGLLAVIITLLTKRSADRALEKAVENPVHGMVVMFSGFALRYLIAILGLLIGFKALQFQAVPMITGFVLVIIVQLYAVRLVKA
ncbi:MAG: ATP synthase subunit I [Gammaproteobacteria bacterium]|nr:MAG: ATP synthase subunit I [Gammaproteobacteria bacterium]